MGNQNIQQLIRHERLRLVYENLPRSLVPSLLVASLLAVALAGVGVALWVTASWWLIMLALTIERSWWSEHFPETPMAVADYKRWELICVRGALFTGIGFGIGGVLLGEHTPQEFQSLVILMLAGIAGGALPFLAMYLPAYGAFILALSLPNIGWLIWQGQKLGSMSAMVFSIYLLALWFSAQQVHRLLEKSLALRFENESLARSLEYEKQHLEEINNVLERLSHVDGLTQLANRRYFDKRFKEEWYRGLREELPISLIILDIDYFKNYNDSYGHLAGDECLKRVASTINHCVLRPGDLVARYGGEEFVVLLSNTTKQGAENVAIEILEKIRELGLPHQSSSVEDYLTISIGVASVVPSRDIPRAYLLETADLALYKSKNAGRNRMTSESLDPPNADSVQEAG